jgi:hypothetical protein
MWIFLNTFRPNLLVLWVTGEVDFVWIIVQQNSILTKQTTRIGFEPENVYKKMQNILT